MIKLVIWVYIVSLKSIVNFFLGTTVKVILVVQHNNGSHDAIRKCVHKILLTNKMFY